MDVARGLKGDPCQEFRKEEGLEGLQASARGGAFTATSVPDVSVRNHQPPPVPSISGGFTFRKLSDIQECFLTLVELMRFQVPKWSANPLKSRDHHHYSSEDDVTFVPVSQQNGSLTHQKVHVSHITAVIEFPTRKEDALNDAPGPQDFVCGFCSLDFVFLEL
ncbi:unnamed protein product [Sphagnum compactum]